MNRTIPAVGAFAFWKYDQYPYLLGGEITHNHALSTPDPDAWHRRDTVFIGSYGSYFRPLFCLDAETGPAALAEIERLREVASDAQRALSARLADARRNSPLHKLDPRP